MTQRPGPYLGEPLDHLARQPGMPSNQSPLEYARAFPAGEPLDAQFAVADSPRYLNSVSTLATSIAAPADRPRASADPIRDQRGKAHGGVLQRPGGRERAHPGDPATVAERTVAEFRSNRALRASKAIPALVVHQAASRPRGVSRRSALSIRRRSRCSARDVNIR